MEKTVIADFIQSVRAVSGSGYRLEKLELANKVVETDSLEAVNRDVHACRACKLAASRNTAVPGEGVNDPVLLVIGEGPGAEEDRSGRPFVGPAGQLLDKMLGAIGIDRSKNCYIANVVKCRPPQNRDPQAEETEACASFLCRQIHVLKPSAILLAGRVSAHVILNCETSLGKLRGTFYEYLGIPVLVTYHPSALLRDENLKRPAWEDLKLLRSFLLEHDSRYAENTGSMKV